MTTHAEKIRDAILADYEEWTGFDHDGDRANLRKAIDLHIGPLLDAANLMAVAIDLHCEPDCPTITPRKRYLEARDRAAKGGTP